MKLAIMQPYLFPYIGYFQLVAAVDRFVFLDDAAFMKQGWINRNRLRIGGAIRYFTVPVINGSSNRSIKEVAVLGDPRWRRKMTSAVAQSYARAPFVEAGLALLEDAVGKGDGPVSELAARSVMAVARYLSIRTDFAWSSIEHASIRSRGAQRVIDICRRDGADGYVNLPGGRHLYDPSSFGAAGISLDFIEPNLAPYPQGADAFEPGLSMLDVVMFNDPASVRRMVGVGGSS